MKTFALLILNILSLSILAQSLDTNQVINQIRVDYNLINTLKPKLDSNSIEKSFARNYDGVDEYGDTISVSYTHLTLPTIYSV